MILKGSYLLNIDAMACATEDQACLHGLGEATSLYQLVSDAQDSPLTSTSHLSRNFFLVFFGEVDKMIVLGSN